MTGRDAGREQLPGRPGRLPMPRRTRRRWTVAIIVAAGWLSLYVMTGSVIAAAMLLIVLAGLGVVVVFGLRALGVTRDHPWVRRLAERPWRDGQDVLRLAVAHLREVFVITPSGSLLAPDLVELRMNPRDLQSLSEHMDLSVASESAAEVYQEQVSAADARLAGHLRPEVRIIGDPSVPAGRYQLRQGQPVGVGRPAGYQPGGGSRPGLQPAYAGSQAGLPSAPAGLHAVRRASSAAGRPAVDGPYPGFNAHDGNTRSNPGPDEPRTEARPDQPRTDARPDEPRTEARPDQPRTEAQPSAAPTAGSGMPTVAELSSRRVPLLRLVTGNTVVETRTSGARAGRGAVELKLPQEPTVSREHARFTFSEGRWWIANLGRNGLTLNGAPLSAEQALDDGDVIRWGMKWNALLSRVEIG
jgi:FHA domain